MRGGCLAAWDIGFVSDWDGADAFSFLLGGESGVDVILTPRSIFDLFYYLGWFGLICLLSFIILVAALIGVAGSFLWSHLHWA